MAFASKSNAFVTSCCTKEKCGGERSVAIFRSAPVIKLSAHSTLCPSSSKRAQRWEPIKPAPPVTTIFKNRTSKHEEEFLSSNYTLQNETIWLDYVNDSGLLRQRSLTPIFLSAIIKMSKTSVVHCIRAVKVRDAKNIFMAWIVGPHHRKYCRAGADRYRDGCASNYAHTLGERGIDASSTKSESPAQRLA